MNALDTLISSLRTLPGVGKRAAQKMALHLLLDREKNLEALQNALMEANRDIRNCHVCGNLDATDPCAICSDENRDAAKLCIVPMVNDLWALERTKFFRGRYHVLGGLLSAMNGVGPEQLRIRELENTVRERPGVQEVIFALPASVEGASTAHHLLEVLQPILPDAVFTRLAQGMPMGGNLDMLDEGTLGMALSGRSRI